MAGIVGIIAGGIFGVIALICGLIYLFSLCKEKCRADESESVTRIRAISIPRTTAVQSSHNQVHPFTMTGLNDDDRNFNHIGSSP